MNILIIGQNGQLAQSIQQVINTKTNDDHYTFSTRRQLDLSNLDSIDHYFAQHKFDVIINCAAYTLVDRAESEVKLANTVNHLAVKKIAMFAQQSGSKLIHISTDYVFSGHHTVPYTEEDNVCPCNVYGQSKLAGEQAVLSSMKNNAIIIRTAWLYSQYGHNFFNTMLKLTHEKQRLTVVNDQISSPTYAVDLAKVIIKITQHQNFRNNNPISQLYHYANQGGVSWYKFAQKIVELGKIDCHIDPITTENYPTIAKRPKFTVMSSHKISQEFDLTIAHWQDSLVHCLNSFKKQSCPQKQF